MSQSHHNHHNHRIPVSFESKQPSESFEIIKVEVQIHQSLSLAPGPRVPRSRRDGLLGFGVCLQARKVCRDGLQQTDHATRLAGHATVGTGHGLKRAMARHGVPNGLERNTVQLQPGRRFFALHQGQATGLVEPQPQKAQRAQRAQQVTTVTRISLDSYEATTSEILPRSPDSFSALMASSTAACAFWACQNITMSRFHAKQPASHCIMICSLEVGFQEMVLRCVEDFCHSLESMKSH